LVLSKGVVSYYNQLSIQTIINVVISWIQWEEIGSFTRNCNYNCISKYSLSKVFVRKIQVHGSPIPNQALYFYTTEDCIFFEDFVNRKHCQYYGHDPINYLRALWQCCLRGRRTKKNMLIDLDTILTTMASNRWILSFQYSILSTSVLSFIGTSTTPAS
jgi:hypothetical protein